MQPFTDFADAGLARMLFQQLDGQEAFEFATVAAGEGMGGEPVAQKGIEGLASETLFEEHQEPLALDVGHIGECPIRITAGQGRQGQHLIGRRHALQFFEQSGLADDVLHIGQFAAEDLLDDSVLDVTGETFVQPDVFPGAIGDQIA